MKRFALAAVAVVALAGTMTATAAPEDNSTIKSTHPHVAPPPGCTAKAFREFSAKVWRLDHWDRGRHGMPKDSTVEAQRHRLACAGPGNRAAMKRIWQHDKTAFFDYRQEKISDRRYFDAVTPPGLGILRTIAACESGGDPTAVSPDGTYRGKYQFDYGTWASVGGSGDPAAASEHEQDIRAAILYNRSGSSPWPVCGV